MRRSCDTGGHSLLQIVLYDDLMPVMTGLGPAAMLRAILRRAWSLGEGRVIVAATIT